MIIGSSVPLRTPRGWSVPVKNNDMDFFLKLAIKRTADARQNWVRLPLPSIELEVYNEEATLP